MLVFFAAAAAASDDDDAAASDDDHDDLDDDDDDDDGHDDHAGGADNYDADESARLICLRLCVTSPEPRLTRSSASAKKLAPSRSPTYDVQITSCYMLRSFGRRVNLARTSSKQT